MTHEISPRAWQRMLSGRRLNLVDPSPLDIEIEDIAHGLARVARWNGQTTGQHIFSVAQHSLLVLHLFKRIHPKHTLSDQQYALLHDASEYVIGDIISPLKQAIGSQYQTIELRLMQIIHQRFGLSPEPEEKIKKLIKKADITAAFYEATILAEFTHGGGR